MKSTHMPHVIAGRRRQPGRMPRPLRPADEVVEAGAGYGVSATRRAPAPTHGQSSGLMEEMILPAVAGSGPLLRLGGGSETDVYGMPDGRHVVKVKEPTTPTLPAALAQAVDCREAAAQFGAYLGPAHTVPTDCFLARDESGHLWVVAYQPALQQARPLAAISYRALRRERQLEIEAQLLTLLRRSLRCYRQTGHMPDLYGTYSRNRAERHRINTPLHWPRRVARFFTQRLWHSHNLLLEGERVVLVDYDRVRWRGAWGQLYYAICWLLFVRDVLHLAWRQRRPARPIRDVLPRMISAARSCIAGEEDLTTWGRDELPIMLGNPPLPLAVRSGYSTGD